MTVWAPFLGALCGVFLAIVLAWLYVTRWVRNHLRQALPPFIAGCSSVVAATVPSVVCRGVIAGGCGAETCDDPVCRHSEQWEGFIVNVKLETKELLDGVIEKLARAE